MGRLIDANKLLKMLGLSEKTRKYGGDHSGYDTRMLYEIQDTIEDAAEVDAIPVPWIEKYIADCGVDGTVTMLSAKAVNTMLEVWKEEHERV